MDRLIGGDSISKLKVTSDRVLVEQQPEITATWLRTEVQNARGGCKKPCRLARVTKHIRSRRMNETV